jgi:hypothetical protein
VSVHSALPQFSTASGWELGPVIATLSRGTPVQVCETRSVGFPGDKKVWLLIRFEQAGRSSEGWIYGERTLASAGRVRGAILASFFLPAVAYAEDTAEDTGTEAGLPGTSSLWLFYGWAFLAICLGMAAKSAFDWLQQGGNLVPHDYLVRTLPPLLVSPMVFLSLSQLGNIQFGPDGHGFLVSLCTAFQSGFFWQTVLVRSTPATERSTSGLMPVSPTAAVS